MKLVKESLLKESPDKIIGPDGDLYTARHSTSKNYSFEVILNIETEEIADVLVSKKSNEYHGDDPITHGQRAGTANKTQVSFNKKGTYKFDWEKVYPGRLFTGPKVITFWVYPAEHEMRKIIDIIEKKMKIKMINNGWNIEVYDQGIKNKGVKSYSNNYDRDNKSKLLPIEQFIGSQKPPEKEYLQHLDTKHKNPVIQGFGSRNPDYMTKRKWQMATIGMESKREEFFPRLFEENEKK